jgi:hypothetical protein
VSVCPSVDVKILFNFPVWLLQQWASSALTQLLPSIYTTEARFECLPGPPALLTAAFRDLTQSGQANVGIVRTTYFRILC